MMELPDRRTVPRKGNASRIRKKMRVMVNESGDLCEGIAHRAGTGSHD